MPGEEKIILLEFHASEPNFQLEDSLHAENVGVFKVTLITILFLRRRHVALDRVIRILNVRSWLEIQALKRKPESFQETNLDRD